MSSRSPNSLSLSRRTALAALAGSAAVGGFAHRALAQAAAPAPQQLLPAANVCLVTPEQTEGPYYFDPKLERADITEGKPGIPLRFQFQVIEGATCAPIAGARVDIWHCDATGHYSGYTGQGDGGANTQGMTFLRGTQFADASGRVSFDTIFPGWYRGRTNHVHLKVYLDQTNALTSQTYFPDALNEFVYTQVAPYNARVAARDTLNVSDSIAREAGDAFASIKEERTRYVASLLLGVNRAARSGGFAVPGGGPGGPLGGPGGAGGPPPAGGFPPGGPPGGQAPGAAANTLRTFTPPLR